MLHSPAALLLKGVILGDSKTGKSTLLQRWFSIEPKHGYRATIDADYVGDFIGLSCNSIAIRLKLLDTPGRKDFQVVSCPLFRGSNFLVLIFNNQSSFERISDLLDDFRLNMWGQDGNSKQAASFPVFLIDADFDEPILSEGVALERPKWNVRKFAMEHNIWATYSLSPALDTNVRLQSILNDIVGRVFGDVLPDTDEAKRCRLLMYARTLLFAPPSSSLASESIRKMAVYQMSLTWIGIDQYGLESHHVQFILKWSQSRETLGLSKERFLECVNQCTTSNSPISFKQHSKQQEKDCKIV